MRKYRNLCASVAAIASAMLFSTFAQAESFSFDSTSEATNQIIIPFPNGIVGGSTWLNGKSTVTDSKRGKLTNTFVCAMNSNPPQEFFNQRMFCDVKESDSDTFSIFAGCNFINPERTESTCVGGLIGKTGIYEGRAGSITWHGKLGVDASSHGAGVWNE